MSTSREKDKIDDVYNLVTTGAALDTAAPLYVGKTATYAGQVSLETIGAVTNPSSRGVSKKWPGPPAGAVPCKNYHVLNTMLGPGS